MVALHLTPASLGSRSVKKGRHRRFEEARKLKQSGPDFLFSSDTGRSHDDDTDVDDDDDEYAALARKDGALDDDDKGGDED